MTEALILAAAAVLVIAFVVLAVIPGAHPSPWSPPRARQQSRVIIPAATVEQLGPGEYEFTPVPAGTPGAVSLMLTPAGEPAPPSKPTVAPVSFEFTLDAPIGDDLYDLLFGRSTTP
jgi:hypothetical protein